MLDLKIASLENKIFHGEVEKVTIKTISGEVTLYPNHVPYISLIKNGYVKYIEENNEKILEVKDGNISLTSNNVVTILVNNL